MSYPFVKLNRYIIEDDIFKNEKALKFYIWLLCKATYKESDIIVGRQQVHLNKGELVFGLNSASKELSIGVHNLRDLLSAFKRANKISVKSTNKYSVITLLDKEIFTINPNSLGNQDGSPSGSLSGNNKEYIDANKLRRFLFATQTPKTKEKFSYAGYDLDLYGKMLDSDDCY